MIAEAVRLVKAGNSLREVADAAGVSHMSVARWVKDATPAPAGVPADVKARAQRLVKKADAVAPPPPVDPMAGVDENDSLAFAKAQRRAYLQAAAAAQAEGSHAAAQRAHRDAAQMSILIARLEKAQAAEGDEVRIPRAELERAEAEIEARLLTLTGGPVLCGECRRKLFG